jgi:DNA-binding NarL/FixJ family response regulator
MKPVSLLVVDDNDKMRARLCSLLACVNDLKVIGESKDGEDAIIKSGHLHPDVILMDITMPKLDGIKATEAIKKTNPDTRVVIFSAYDDREQAKAAGVDSYLLKGDPIEKILKCIKTR